MTKTVPFVLHRALLAQQAPLPTAADGRPQRRDASEDEDDDVSEADDDEGDANDDDGAPEQDAVRGDQATGSGLEAGANSGGAATERCAMSARHRRR